MNIHEYQAKHILQKYDVPILDGVVILNKDDIDYAIDNFNAKIFVIKAQIHAGGRGIAGGVQVAHNKEDAKKLAHAMMGTSLVTIQTHREGQRVKRIYIEEYCDILQEYYFSLILDRDKETLLFIVSTEGGVDIEEVASNNAEKIITIPVNPKIGLQDFHYRKLAIALGFNHDKATQLKKIAKGIYNVFVENNANQIEINPLVVNKKGSLIVLDTKISFDDNSLFLHPEIIEMRDESEEDPLEIAAMNDRFNYIKMFGNIGCMVNGAGLAMATMDIIKLYGGEVANFLDVGGAADQARVTNAFKIILSDSKVKAILVNIFGGIVRCDIIAKAIVEAVYDIGIHVPLVVRLAGTNYQLGNDILKSSGLKIITAIDLDEAASKIVAQVSMTSNKL